MGESGRDRGEREDRRQGGGSGSSPCGNNSDPGSRKVAWEMALRWRQGWEGSRGWRFHGIGVMGQSWAEITLRDAPWPRPGCLRRKGKLPGWTPGRRALGNRAEVGAVVLLGQWGLCRPLPGPWTKPEQSLLSGSPAGGGAELEAWSSVSFHLPSTPLSRPGWVRRGVCAWPHW